jgi:hypothetical protein
MSEREDDGLKQRKRRAKDETVMAFLRQVYGEEYLELAIASFDEEHTLRTATELLAARAPSPDLTAALARVLWLEAALQEIARKRESPNMSMPVHTADAMCQIANLALTPEKDEETR